MKRGCLSMSYTTTRHLVRASMHIHIHTLALLTQSTNRLAHFTAVSRHHDMFCFERAHASTCERAHTRMHAFALLTHARTSRLTQMTQYFIALYPSL